MNDDRSLTLIGGDDLVDKVLPGNFMPTIQVSDQEAASFVVGDSAGSRNKTP
jgi:hypothetical protein